MSARSGGAAGRRRHGLVLAVAALGCLRYDGEPPEAIDPGPAPGVPALHHAHLNSIDPDAAIDFYLRLRPSGTREEIAGHPAFAAEMALLFDRVDTPPAGAWSPRLERSDPQSAFWHMGAFVNTTGLPERLASEGIDVLPLWTGPDDAGGVLRSGLTPYAGIVGASALADAEAAPPRSARRAALESGPWRSGAPMRSMGRGVLPLFSDLLERLGPGPPSRCAERVHVRRPKFFGVAPGVITACHGPAEPAHPVVPHTGLPSERAPYDYVG